MPLAATPPQNILRGSVQIWRRGSVWGEITSAKGNEGLPFTFLVSEVGTKVTF